MDWVEIGIRVFAGAAVLAVLVILFGLFYPASVAGRGRMFDVSQKRRGS